MVKASFLVALLLICTTGHPSRARADEAWQLVQLTCAPELSYFMVRTFQHYNPPAPERRRKYGIYALRDLWKKPLMCTIGGLRLAFKLTSYHQPEEKGNCGGVEDAQAIITANGATRLEMLYTHGGCTNLVSHTIEISVSSDSGFFKLRHCRNIEEWHPIQYDEPDKDEHQAGARCTESYYDFARPKKQKLP